MIQLKLENKKKKNLMDVAYETLKDSICNNSIKPGTLLSETVIAEQLEMSRTPVREALKALSVQGFVEIKNGIGAYVKGMSSKEISDIYEVRKALEGVAAKTAIKRITKKDIEELEADFKYILDSAARGDSIGMIEFVDIDLKLHVLIIKRCDNEYVKSIMERIYDNIRRVQTMSFEALNDLEESTRQHLHLLDLIKKGDTEILEKALEEHCDWAYQWISS